MIAVVQRVNEASVEVEDQGITGSIDAGLCVLLGVLEGDTEIDATWMAGKIARLRIFADEAGRFNHSVQEIGGGILLVSQFTLAGDSTKGNRPSFIDAAPAETAEALYELVGTLLEREHELPVARGRFQKMMKVRLENDGPATIILRSPGGA